MKKICGSFAETATMPNLIKPKPFDPVTNSTVPIFNPRTQIWNEHFEMSKNGTQIIGKTPIGRGTVEALKLNDERVGMGRGWLASAERLTLQTSQKIPKIKRKPARLSISFDIGLAGIIGISTS
jgi:hypothetical protein